MAPNNTLLEALHNVGVRLLSLVDLSVDFASQSILIATGGMFVSQTWRKRKGYFFASIITGTVAGVVATKTPLVADFDYMISLAGAITGPATLAYLQHKTIFELIDMAKGVFNRNNKSDQ